MYSDPLEASLNAHGTPPPGMEQYTYESLPNTDSIRLLFVEPVMDHADEIRCSLRSFPISRESEYQALSYSWGMDDGDDSICEQIIVDGRSLGVTRNLFEGLRRIFARDQFQKPIWIDAVCIDQNNVEERSSQVARMGEIFSNAGKVLCWLGEGTDKRENDNMVSVFSCLKSGHSGLLDHEVILADGSNAHVCLFVQCGRLGSPSDRQNHLGVLDLPDAILGFYTRHDSSWVEAFRIVTSFLSKRYWHRLWIVQELFHAPKPIVFLWADHYIEEELLLALIDPLHWWMKRLDSLEPGSVATLRGELLNVLARCYAIFHIRRGQRTYDLWEWIAACYRLQCSNHKDRIYALISLDPRCTIRPDYSLTTAQVYMAFAVDHQKRYNTANLLLRWAVGSRQPNAYINDGIMESLPSWCPHIRSHACLDKYSRRPSIRGEWKIDASGQLQAVARVVGTLSRDKNLVLLGFPNQSVLRSERFDLQAASHPFQTKFYRDSQDRCQQHDLVCVFEECENLQYHECREMNAIVLHPLGNEETVYRVVGALTFSAPDVDFEAYPLQSLRIR